MQQKYSKLLIPPVALFLLFCLALGPGCDNNSESNTRYAFKAPNAISVGVHPNGAEGIYLYIAESEGQDIWIIDTYTQKLVDADSTWDQYGDEDEDGEYTPLRIMSGFELGDEADNLVINDIEVINNGKTLVAAVHRPAVQQYNAAGEIVGNEPQSFLVLLDLRQQGFARAPEDTIDEVIGEQTSPDAATRPAASAQRIIGTVPGSLIELPGYVTDLVRGPFDLSVYFITEYYDGDTVKVGRYVIGNAAVEEFAPSSLPGKPNRIGFYPDNTTTVITFTDNPYIYFADFFTGEEIGLLNPFDEETSNTFEGFSVAGDGKLGAFVGPGRINLVDLNEKADTYGEIVDYHLRYSLPWEAISAVGGSYENDGSANNLLITLNANGELLLYNSDSRCFVSLADNTSEAGGLSFFNSGDLSSPKIYDLTTSPCLGTTRTETWYVTYQGVLPGSLAGDGRSKSNNVFFDPDAEFTELDIKTGDLLEILDQPPEDNYLFYFLLDDEDNEIVDPVTIYSTTITAVIDDHTLMLQDDSPIITYPAPLTYQIRAESDWVVYGTFTEYAGRVNTGESFIHDRVGFSLVAGSYPADRNDTFRFITVDGIQPFVLGTLSRRMTLSPDRRTLFVSSPLSRGVFSVDLVDYSIARVYR